MKIFFTGATGVIGRRALPILIARGHTVTAVLHDERARARVTASGATPVYADLFDPASLRRAMDGHDVLINLATHIPRSPWQMMWRRAWLENDRIRSVGVSNLVEAAQACGVRRVIQESFALAYPDRGDAWIDETTLLEPPSYSRTVLDAEAAVSRYAARGDTGVVLRFAAFYGPDATQVRLMISGARHGWSVLPGAPRGFVSSVSHDDAARAVVAALGVDSGAYNVTDDEPLRRIDYISALADALHVPPPRMLPPWATSLFGSLGRALGRSLRLSNAKLRAATDWRPRYPSMREGWPPTLATLGSTSGSGTPEPSPETFVTDLRPQARDKEERSER